MNNMQEILAGCLKEDANGYVLQSLVAEFPTVKDLINASADEIRLIKGIGIVKARQLNAIIQFVKAVNMPDIDKRIIIRSPRDVYELVRGELEFLQVEKFMVIGLNTKNAVLFKETISSGTLNATIVHPRETFKPLIKRSAANCILVHNHPSSDPTPSHEDISLTKKMVESGKLLSIDVLDHIIVGGGGKYASFKERGLMD